MPRLMDIQKRVVRSKLTPLSKPAAPESATLNRAITVLGKSFTGESVPLSLQATPEIVDEAKRQVEFWYGKRDEPASSLAFPQGLQSTVVSLPSPPRYQRVLMRSWARIGIVLGLCVLTGWGGWLTYRHSQSVKGRVLGVSETGTTHLTQALEKLQRGDINGAIGDFETAALAFHEASLQFANWSASLVEVTRFIPGASQAASGKYAIAAGEELALAGLTLKQVAPVLGAVTEAFSHSGSEDVSLLEGLQQGQESGKATLLHLQAAETALNKVKLNDIPPDKRDQFVELKRRLPEVIVLLRAFLEQDAVLQDLLGGNGPRKYLFLFQNNQELRPTGGFIGSYALLDMADGTVRNFFVDGIFNPDGQLKEDIVPPGPLQKVTSGWSLHDSNWWPDFPRSAEKAIFFYEKTSGPTVDGVIAVTPVVLEKLLRLTGPIEMPEYGVTVNADNYLPVIQEEVEVNYDKELNQPKKILADLAPKIAARLGEDWDIARAKDLLNILQEILAEKHMLVYSRQPVLQDLLVRQGWAGEIRASPRDYLAVVHTNINGYKTDGVIDETITHAAEIQLDGSVVDTVTVTRRHGGGHTAYLWWNKVNADYVRVYVPEGARLISASGQTREFTEPPLDYERLGFRRDADVVKEEKDMRVDETFGTRVYEESGKIVFANWVYVSPQETVTLTYTYELPFRITPAPPKAVRGEFSDSRTEDAKYSVYYQKQSGSPGSRLVSSVAFPGEWAVGWQSRADLIVSQGSLKWEGDLRKDEAYSLTFKNSK